MSTIESGLGWSCDSEYYVDDTSTLIGVDVHGHEFRKTAPGGAIGASINVSGGRDCWMLISTILEYAATDGSSYLDPMHTTTYDGITWYITAPTSGNDSQPSSFPYANPDNPIPANSFDYSAAALAIIEAANVQKTAKQIATTNYVKTFVEGVEAETASRVNALDSAKQPKTMSAAITVDGTLQATVEGAIGAVNNYTSAKISDIYAILGTYGNDVFGLQVDFENYTYTRLAGAVGKTGGTDFNAIAPWSGMRRCNLADDGTVNAYYGDVSYIEDGSNGQVMVEIPKFYYRVVPLKTEAIGDSVGGKHLRKANYYLSTTKYEGFKTHPAFVKPDGTERDKAYVSAYEGCIYDVSASAYILDDAQVGNFTASTGDKLSSIAGAKPCSGKTQNLTRANSEVIATNRGTGWHCMEIKAVSALQWLFMIEYGTLNSQNAIGNGVVDKANGEVNNAENTGATASLGNTSGMASGTEGLVSVSYRGVENFWGNIWKFIEGLTLWGDGTLRGGQPYICDDYSFVENTKTGYTAAKFTVSNASSYISAFGYDPDFDWLFLPSECVNADSNYPVGDYAYATSDLNDYRVSLLGAHWSFGVSAGAFYWYLHAGAGYCARHIGVRLMFLP